MIRTGQDGFTLIEGMLAGVVLAVGMLALAAMQSMSLGRNVDANEVTRVTNLAADMMERIQFNRGRAAAYNGALGTGIDTLNGATQPAATEPMARGDYTQWQTLLNNSGLTGVRGLVVVTALDPAPALNPVTLNRSQVAVTITWLGSVKSDTSVRRNKTMTLITIVAPE
jgi:type IV pilus assembly protein PilV